MGYKDISGEEGFADGIRFIGSYYDAKHSILVLRLSRVKAKYGEYSSEPDKFRGQLGSLEQKLKDAFRDVRAFNSLFRKMEKKYGKFFEQEDATEALNEELAEVYRELKPYLKPKTQAEKPAMEE